jgi:hypothetical protein
MTSAPVSSSVFTLSGVAFSDTKTIVGASPFSTLEPGGIDPSPEGTTRIGLFPGASRFVRIELSILIVLLPTMIASNSERFRCRNRWLSSSMSPMIILLDRPRFSVSLPSTVISEMSST